MRSLKLTSLFLLCAGLGPNAFAGRPCPSVYAIAVPDAPVEESVVGISNVEGPEVNLWSAVGVKHPKNDVDVELKLSPNNPLIIGRSEQTPPPYLDPAYRPTTIAPGGKRVTAGSKKDMLLSRAHFMLRAHSQGILLVNGVPSAGGLRAPKNGIRLLEPEARPMLSNENFLIEYGASVKILLPNGTILKIFAGS